MLGHRRTTPFHILEVIIENWMSGEQVLVLAPHGYLMTPMALFDSLGGVKKYERQNPNFERTATPQNSSVRKMTNT